MEGWQLLANSRFSWPAQPRMPGCWLPQVGVGGGRQRRPRREPGSPFAPLRLMHATPQISIPVWVPFPCQLFISCQEQNWTLWSAGSLPSQAVGDILEDLLALSPPGLERLYWSGGSGGAWASFRRLQRPSFGSSQEDRPQPRQPHPPAQTSVLTQR